LQNSKLKNHPKPKDRPYKAHTTPEGGGGKVSLLNAAQEGQASEKVKKQEKGNQQGKNTQDGPLQNSLQPHSAEECDTLEALAEAYVPLKNHSSYSLLEGMMHPEALVGAVKNQGCQGVGIADSANLFGAMAFSLAGQKEGVKPVLGCLFPVLLEEADVQKNEEGALCEKSALGAQQKEPTTLLRDAKIEAKAGLHVSGRTMRSSPFQKVYKMPLFVQNQEGYENLCYLVSQLTLEEEAQRRGGLSLSDIAPYTKGLIALSGGHEGPLEGVCELLGEAGGEVFFQKCAHLFDKRFYAEIERYERPGPYEGWINNWALKYNIPLVATNEAFFLSEDDHAAHDALLCIKDGTYVSEEARRRVTPHHRLKSPHEMARLFQDLPEAIFNTQHVMKRCSYVLTAQKPTLPPYPVDKGLTQKEVLINKAQQGLEKRLDKLKEKCAEAFDDLSQRYQRQLHHELAVIHSMGFDGYFLIVADFIQWAKEKGISVGPGRGSGAGSLVAYALSITDVDPLRFGLLFERFLNPERISMPDFDIDFCPKRRDEVIAYVQSKYGEGAVAHIITFGKLQARAVLRDVGRVLGMPYGQVDKLAKRVPFNPQSPLTLEEVLAQDAELRQMCEDDEGVKGLFDYARRLEGLYRHASTHAAGVVIGHGPLTKQLALYKDPKSALPATAFSMKYVEMMGLVKFDFLGLKNLTVLEGVVRLLKDRGQDVCLTEIPFDDPKAFRLLRAVQVVGLFQLESAGMRDVLAKLQPEAFEEIIALVALYRPGPMDDIPYYIACRHGREKVVYAYPCLEDILRPTFGVMVYQEQVLKIAQVLAGYSLGQADVLRRAMGKKIKHEMDAQRTTFIEGVLKNAGGPAEKASHLFDQIAKFAGYAFVKAHATPYALITYQTAYMKANYPLEFMISLMNEDVGVPEKLSVIVREAKSMGLVVLPPDINASNVLFQAEKNTVDDEGLENSGAQKKADGVESTKKVSLVQENGDVSCGDSTEEGIYNATGRIRYGLAALKNVGEGAMEVVVAEREKNGPYTSIFDFYERLAGTKVLNKRQMEYLIWAGAFDSLHSNRHQLIASLEVLLATRHADKEAPMLFGATLTRPSLKSVVDYGLSLRLKHEYGAVGLYLRSHPIEIFQKLLKNVGVLTHEEGVALIKDRLTFKVAAVLSSMQMKVGRSGKRYAFLGFSDPSGLFEAIAFEDTFFDMRDVLKEGELFLITLEGHKANEGWRFMVKEMRTLEGWVSKLDVVCLKVTPLQDLKVLTSLREEGGEEEGGEKQGFTRVFFDFYPALYEGKKYRLIAACQRPRTLNCDQLAQFLEKGFDIALKNPLEMEGNDLYANDHKAEALCG